MLWSQIPIKECGEPLVKARGERIFWAPVYVELGLEDALDDVWLRDEAARRLRLAAGMLPGGFSLVLWDGWRPVSVQRQLYERYRGELESSGLEGNELDRETLRYVSLPSEDPHCPSPHLTGGTIDLTLGDRDGNPLDMGGNFDELGERSGAFFYEGASSLFRERRRLLRGVMVQAGWSPYPEEWWHFDFGNQFHHARRGGVARYGPVSPF